MALFAATAWDRGQRLNAQAAEIARLQESRRQLTGQRASVRENAELMAENVLFGSQNVPVDPLAADSATPIGPTNPWDAFHQIVYGSTVGNPYVTGTGQAAGGLVGAVLSTGALDYSGGTAVPAYGILGYSLDQLQAGVGTVWTGEVVSTLGASALGAGVEYVTGSSTAGALAGFGYDVGGGFLTGSYLSQARYANASARGLVSVPRSTGPRLVHMTEAGDAIRSSGRLGLPGDLYAGPASNAGRSGWGLTGRTGLSPSGNFEPIFIPEAAEAAFRRPIPVGIGTGWQRLTGQQYAPRGIIDLGTGEFTRTGINRTQALWYSFDVGVGTVLGGSAAAYWYSTGDGE
ncbi:MAG: hypothetical protein AAF790_15150 [Planctomycetota bacterium]